MIIKTELCTACGLCRPYCPVGALEPTQAPPGLDINRDACVECEACLRAGVCLSRALRPEDLPWPRLVRSLFSNPRSVHQEPHIPGRGTEEMKTNDLTGRLRAGIASLAIELGRPGLGTDFGDIQIVTEACAARGCRFEPANPLTRLMVDPGQGKLRADILKERVLSAIIEVNTPLQGLPALVEALRQAATQIRTVFSLGLSYLACPSTENVLAEILPSAGIQVRPNGKINVGLGRPLYDFSSER